MLDKVTPTVLCTVSVDLTSNGAQLSVKLKDYMGALDSRSLCYLIRALTIEDIWLVRIEYFILYLSNVWGGSTLFKGHSICITTFHE